MAAKIEYFPVGNGDMALVEFESGKQLLIDVNVREAADDADDDTPDVMAKLKERLKKDSKGRWVVDAFLLSHPDQDHCRGFKKHFYVGSAADFPEKSTKIFVKELWSSPMVFRRASTLHTLCEDAETFNTEARRRVAKFRAIGNAVVDGDRILILGEDQNGKTDDLGAILIKVDQEFQRIAGASDTSWKARLLAPLPPSNDADEEATLSKNQSSTILQFTIAADGNAAACRYLTAGDAEVAIWERLWQRHKNRAAWLEYDILLAPHHCSWHSLSYDSWSEKGDDAQVNADARSALSQARTAAAVVSSSKPIKDDDVDPPCIRAKREYEDIVGDVGGTFHCTDEHPTEAEPDVMIFEIGKDGPRLRTRSLKVPYISGGTVVGREPLPHG
jgi:hypothetical protein